MAAITAAAVKSLRERTGLPMMDCKQALVAADGDEEKAVEELRKKGAKTLERRSGRATSFGRMGIFVDPDSKVGAMVELKCESAPVAKNEEFVQLADDLAKQLATGPGAETAEELLAQPCPSQDGTTLAEVKDEMFNRMREVFNIGRIRRVDGHCGGYSHNLGTTSGVLIVAEGGSQEALKDVAMHVTALKPAVLKVEELDSETVAKEREILSAAAREEGKPENIIEKMVDGRMRNYYAQHVLLEQPFVKDDKMTVDKFAAQNGMEISEFIHWELEAVEEDE